jgi:hypothetical protein
LQRIREERGENINVETCEGEKRENKMFYNLIMHMTGVYNVFQCIEKQCRCHLMLVKFVASDVGVFFEIFLKHKKLRK